METVYFYCAVIGGGLLVIQTLLLVIGGADTDVDTDVDLGVGDLDAGDIDGGDIDGGHGSILFQLSFKTIIAFFTFFGLAGMASVRNEMSMPMTVVISVAAGLIAFYIVGYLMRLLASLQSQGNVDLSKAVGSAAKVYLRIPEKRTGFGKVTVAVQGRTLTRKAVTAGDAIPTGSEVVIRAMNGPDAFEVAAPQ